MTNKLSGNRFEAELCGILAEHGFWAHNMTQNQAGQPADIIAVKEGWAVLIDCKLCSGKRFSFARIEPNQASAMDLWHACGNRDTWFAVKTPDGEIGMINWRYIKILQEQGAHSSICKDHFRLANWLKYWDTGDR